MPRRPCDAVETGWGVAGSPGCPPLGSEMTVVDSLSPGSRDAHVVRLGLLRLSVTTWVSGSAAGGHHG